MLSLSAPLSPAIDGFVNPENSDSVHMTHLNTVILQVHRSVGFETLVQDMGSHLTNGNDTIRARATLLLAEILSRLPDMKIQEKSLHYFIEFFCGRLEDYPCLSPCLKAIDSMLKSHSDSLNVGDVVFLCQALFKSVHIPSLGQSLRRQCFEILLFLLQKEKYVEEIEKVYGKEFCIGFLHSMEGEKDPRILPMCFKCAKIIVQKFPIVIATPQLIREMFDITSCYFPITFHRPENDPHGVSIEELKQLLSDVFASSHAMMDYVIPLLLEKLDTNAENAKLDSIQVLSDCCRQLGVAAMGKHLEVVRSAVYNDIINSQFPTVVEVELQFIMHLSAIVAQYTEETKNYTPWNDFVAPIVDRSVLELKGAPDLMLSRSAGRILQAVGKESLYAFSFVLQHAIPILLYQFQNSDKPSHLEAVLVQLVSFINIINKEVDQSHKKNPMLPYVEKILEALEASVQDSHDENRRLSIEGLCHLIVYPPSPLVDLKKIGALVELFGSSVLYDKVDLVSHEALNALKAMAGKPSCVSYILEIALPMLMSFVEDCKEEDHSLDRKTYVLQAITELCYESHIFRAAIPHFVALAISIVDLDNAYVREDRKELTAAVMESLSRVIVLNSNNVQCMDYCILGDSSSSLVPLNLLLLRSLVRFCQQEGRQMDSFNAQILASCVTIMRTTTQHASADSQAVLCSQVVDMFLGQSTEKQLLQVDAPTCHKQLIAIFSSVISSLKPHVEIPLQEKVVGSLLEFSLHLQDDQQHDYQYSIAASQCLASIINKLPKGQELDTQLDLWVRPKLLVYASEKGKNSYRLSSLRCLLWIVKGLLARSHPEGTRILEYFLSTLANGCDETDSESLIAIQCIAQGFEILMGEYDGVLCKSSGANISKLYKQRIYATAFPRLLKSIQHSNQESLRAAYLVAISQVLSKTPKSILICEIDKVLPIIICAMQSHDKELNNSGLMTFKVLLLECLEKIKSHLHTVIPLLLKLSFEGRQALVRYTSLECLLLFTKLSYNEIHPYKDTVVSGLLKPLDDSKRSVRRLAVKVRNEWYVFSTIVVDCQSFKKITLTTF